MTSSPFKVERSLGGSEGGVQVAVVKVSTSFRTKKRGNVPPRFETLQGHVSLARIKTEQDSLSGQVGRPGKADLRCE